MGKRENIIPYSTIGDLITEYTSKRVSKDARISGAQILEDLTTKIVHKANLLAEHSNRKTIKAKDLRLALSQLGGNR